MTKPVRPHEPFPPEALEPQEWRDAMLWAIYDDQLKAMWAMEPTERGATGTPVLTLMRLAGLLATWNLKPAPTGNAGVDGYLTWVALDDETP